MSSRAITWDRDDSPLWQVAGVLLRPLHLALAFPSVLYVGAMAVFLFRPPDLFSFYADRIAFGVLVFMVSLRAMALHEKIPFFAGLSVPMLGLATLAVFRALREPFDAQVWSIIASKFIVPFSLFHIAVLVFRGAQERRHFEIFVVVVLAYLVFIALAFLVDAGRDRLGGSPPGARRCRLRGLDLCRGRLRRPGRDERRGPAHERVAPHGLSRKGSGPQRPWSY